MKKLLSVARWGVVLLVFQMSGGTLAQHVAEVAEAPDTADTAAPEEVTTAPARAGVSRQRIESVVANIAEAHERLAPLVEAVDVEPARAWLAESTLERLTERASDPDATEAEQALWREAAAHEAAGAERIQGALDRAGFALATADRLDEARRRLDEIDGLLDEPRPSEEAQADDERPLSRVNDELTAANARMAQVVLELEQRRNALARLEEQLRGQGETIERLRREREQASPGESDAGQVEATPPIEGEEKGLADARAAARDAAVRRQDAPLIAAQLDALSLPVRVQLLKLEIAVFELEEAALTEQLVRLQAELTERSTVALRELSAELQRLVEREPYLAEHFGAEITALRTGIDRAAETQGRIRGLQRERQEYALLEDDFKRTLASVRERLEIGGLTEALGTLFLEEQRRLRAFVPLRVERRVIEQEIAQSRLRVIGLREATHAAVPVLGIGEDEGQTMLRDLQSRVAEAQVQAEETLIEQLRLTETQLHAAIALIDELERILRETLLWWPSHAPVGVDWVLRAPGAIVAVIDPEAWRETRAALRAITVERPAAAFATLALVGLLFRAGRRCGPHLRRLAEKTAHRFTDNMALTYKAIGWSLLRALPVPVLLMISSLRLKRLPDTDVGVEIIASVLSTAAIWWLAGHLLALFISRNGVATVHFGWNRVLVERLRRDVKWYMPIQFVLIMCLALAFAHPHDLAFDLFGRSALIAAGLLSGLLIWRLLAPDPELAAGLSEPKRRILRGGAATYAGVIVGLPLAGYLLTAVELYARTIDTAVVLSVVWLGHRLVMRSLVLSETRLRLRLLREQRAKAAAVESNSMTSDGVDVPEPHLSIEDVNQQTRTLIGALAVTLTAVGLFFVWSEVLPALTWLDGVTLWTRSVGEGDAESITWISLQDMLLAIGLGILFVLAGRNLPGLVEILLARSTDMDGAGRYTVTTLLRYAITVVAIVTVSSMIGLRWSELQWMVAALTLGLGFGLQEVVANFVSGVIMLFERPARVGDTITIGEYTGTVAKIRTRATTIVDWDNREVVVPNKNFITERLINWTLSDTMTRIVLPIRVAYDADVDLVIDTLLGIAHSHPAVLKEPPPAALFLQLGESALHFELRVYVAEVRTRLQTTSDLHREIIKVFRGLGIAIAFPQMDLHIRDVPPRRGGKVTRVGNFGVAER